ncbi:membrane protein insertase YidC [Desulfovibrio inopinatus]|uniref:membrane protein insertase YidC n=1 Tax=Desulfovibrio inopinatus TaxID=102109 RepID=UPI00048561F9|nr:membrane protein insertase YidC [Desulfovibrio inopinatus]
MDNKRVIMAVALSFIVLLSWNYFFPPAKPPVETAKPTATASADAQTPTTSSAQTADSTPAAPLEDASFTASKGRSVTVDTPLYRAIFDSNGAVLQRFDLKKYKKTIEPDSPPVDLVTEASLNKAPMGLLVDGKPSWTNGSWTFAGDDVTLAAGENAELTFKATIDGITVTRTLSFDADSYLISESDLLSSDTSATVRLAHTLASSTLTREGDRYNTTRIAYYNASGLNEEQDKDDLEKGILLSDGLEWGAIESNYFALTLLPIEQNAVLKGKITDDIFRIATEVSSISLNSGVGREIATAYYLGPKVTSYLATAPNNLAAIVNYGWFDFIAKPLIKLLHFFYGYVHNYGVAIIILTILIKAIFWPLSQKSYKSMEKMKKLQPLMADLREKYKDDRQKMNEELMQLYKTYKVNPAGGCFPMLIQIPVFIGLYQGLLNAIELRHAPFIAHLPFTDMIWLADLSAKDPYYITPLIMGATMFLQQKMTPSPGDPTQAKIMLLMPIVFTFLFLNFPSGLVVYWMVNNVLSIAQQWLMIRKA